MTECVPYNRGNPKIHTTSYDQLEIMELQFPDNLLRCMPLTRRDDSHLHEWRVYLLIVGRWAVGTETEISTKPANVPFSKRGI